MLDAGLNVLAFIVAIGVLVSVHEFGHFWVARRLGFKVVRFSIGFGRPLAVWRGGAPDYTEYWLSMIPLGGYVKMLDEREGPVAAVESHRSFTGRPVWQRVLVLLAGPGFNFLFAIVAYWALFAAGVPGIKPVVGAVVEGSVAARSGLEADDRILAVGGRETDTWEGATLAIFDEMLANGRLDLRVRDADGTVRNVSLDVHGREEELTEPSALFTGLGIRPAPVLPAVVDEIMPDSPAAEAGLQKGDRVVAADGQTIHGWEDWVAFVRQRPNVTVPLDVERNGERITLTLAIGQAEDRGRMIGRIGAGPKLEFPQAEIDALQAEQRYGLFEALPRGAAKAWEMSALTVRMLARMVVGDVSLKNVSGPLTIATYAGDSAKAGLRSFMNFLAVISISLGILNLLPIPVLDGGQVAYQLAEWVKGSPLSERAVVIGQKIGVFFLIVLMTFVFYNDLTRIFGS